MLPAVGSGDLAKMPKQAVATRTRMLPSAAGRDGCRRSRGGGPPPQARAHVVSQFVKFAALEGVLGSMRGACCPLMHAPMSSKRQAGLLSMSTA